MRIQHIEINLALRDMHPSVIGKVIMHESRSSEETFATMRESTSSHQRRVHRIHRDRPVLPDAFRKIMAMELLDTAFGAHECCCSHGQHKS